MNAKLDSKLFRTVDGGEITDGARLFNYYDCEWVTVDFSRSRVDSEYFDGWFDCENERGSFTLLNGERLAKDKPKWMH